MKSRVLMAVVQLIAHGANGQRQVFAPGEKITVDLPEHDVTQLIQLGSVRDVTAEQAQADADAAQAAQAGQAFAAAREAVLADRASVADETPPELNAAPAAPAAPDDKPAKPSKAKA